jgi:hypothetical protein
MDWNAFAAAEGWESRLCLNGGNNFHRKDAESAEGFIFLFSGDLPSLQLWQGRDAGKQNTSSLQARNFFFIKGCF